MKPTDKDFLLFYGIQIIFMFFIIFFTKLYIERKNNQYLIYVIIFFIIKNIYSIFSIKHLISKYNIKDVKKSALPTYLIFNNLFIIFITFFTGLFLKNKNYLFLGLSIIFTFIHFYINFGMIDVSLNFSLDKK